MTDLGNDDSAFTRPQERIGDGEYRPTIEAKAALATSAISDSQSSGSGGELGTASQIRRPEMLHTESGSIGRCAVASAGVEDRWYRQRRSGHQATTPTRQPA